MNEQAPPNRPARPMMDQAGKRCSVADIASSGPNIPAVLEDVLACQLCRAHLPFPPRPVLRVDTRARILIIGQAPGTRVHQTGIPWNDPSGDRLRQWMEVDRDTFYDSARIAIMPMGFCYPGKGRSGDLPPRPECAPQWHARLLETMPDISLILLVGQYAQRYYLPDAAGTLTERVADHAAFGPRFFPLPHPSPRNQLWLRRHPWFEAEVVSALRLRLLPLL